MGYQYHFHLSAAEVEQASSKQKTGGYSWEIISVLLDPREQRSLVILQRNRICTIKSEDWESTLRRCLVLFWFVFWYVFIPCRGAWDALGTCVHEKEWTSVSHPHRRIHSFLNSQRNSLIPISGFFPVTVLILLQTRRLPCFPFTWLQEAVLPGKGAPPLHCTMAAEAAVSHKTGLASSLLTLCVPGWAPPILLQLSNPGTTTWWALLALCHHQLSINKRPSVSGNGLPFPNPNFLNSVCS